MIPKTGRVVAFVKQNEPIGHPETFGASGPEAHDQGQFRLAVEFIDVLAVKHRLSVRAGYSPILAEEAMDAVERAVLMADGQIIEPKDLTLAGADGGRPEDRSRLASLLRLPPRGSRSTTSRRW